MARAGTPTSLGSRFMENQLSGTMRINKTPSILVAALAMFTIANVASAQWDPYPWKHVPRTADGKVDLNAAPVRTSYGKIDLSGFWMPEKDNIPDGLKLVQTEDLTLLLHESRTIYRQIFTDGRPLPKDPEPTWMGDSIGHWDKDTFVVETIGA